MSVGRGREAKSVNDILPRKAIALSEIRKRSSDSRNHKNREEGRHSEMQLFDFRLVFRFGGSEIEFLLSLTHVQAYRTQNQSINGN